jgi:DNA-binding transcriptional LysR family regulator
MIRSFRRTYPDVDLTLEEANTTRLVAGLRDGELDAVFLRSDAGGDDLQLRRLSEEPMLVVLPASHPAAKSIEIDLLRLRGDPLILTPRDVGPSMFDAVIQACRQAGFEPVLGQPAPQNSSVVNLVAAELGFSLVPASMRQLQVTGVVYREVKGEVPSVLAPLNWIERSDSGRGLGRFQNPERDDTTGQETMAAGVCWEGSATA